MPSNVDQELARVAVEAFSTMSFMFPLEDEGGAAPAVELEQPVTATVQFRGPVAGLLRLSVAGGMLPLLAGNMLGEEEALPIEKQHDALREMLNIICGNLLPVLAGTKAVFDVSAPQVQAGPLEAAPPTDEAGPVPQVSAARLTLDGGPVALALFTRDAVAAGL